MSDVDAMTSVEARLMAAALADLRSDMSELRQSLNGVQKALESLVRMDEQQNNQRQAISRAFDEIGKERDRRETMESRVHLLEVDAPSYRELRRWVIGGVLTGLTLMGAAVFKLLISDPLDRGYTRPQAQVIQQQQQQPQQGQQRE